MSQTENTPKNEPARLIIDGGVAWIHLDEPGKRVNTVSSSMMEWFEKTLESIETAELRGMVLISAKKGTFVAGADIGELEEAADPSEVKAMIQRGHQLVGRLARLPFPVVAAIDGVALGGGLELALACDLRVATTASHTKLGLPEVQLGLIPGLGGTQRLPRLIGVPDALDMILTGKQIPAKKAKRLGLVDELCDPLVLREAALRAIGWGQPGSKGYSGPKQKGPGGLVKKAGNFLAHLPMAKNIVYDKARDTVLEKSGGHYPAPLVAIDVVKDGLDGSLEDGLALEAEAFSRLVVTDVAKGLMSIFFTKNDVEGRATKLAKSSELEIERIAVLGAGFMGAGIAQGLAHKGYEVVLKDRDAESLARGMKQCSELFQGLVKKRKYQPVEAKIALSRILPATDYEGFDRAPMVVEAVFEDVDVKHSVIREVEANGADDLIFASNTSTIPIARLAEASKRPENVIGMHFFSPVHKMPLLEIIKHPKTSKETLAATVDVGRRMGKTIIVVDDGPGFFTSRVLGPFCNEALWCLAEGATIEQIDTAVKGWGWPVGPLALLDEVGIDIAHHAGQVMTEYSGERADTSPIFERMIEAERFGRKKGLGFYDYSKKPKEVDSKVYELIGWQQGDLRDEDIIDRCWLQMLNETARCIEDGVISNPKDIDIGVIFGFGFPPFRGGILREADRKGLDWVVSRLEAFAEQHGDRLEPTQLLKDMAKKGETFHSE